MSGRIALVSGANRGLGFETTRQLARLGYRVFLAARDIDRAEAAADVLRGEQLDVVPYELDVASAESCARLSGLAIDVLVNNAGVMPESDENPLAAGLLSRSALDVAPDLLRESFETNTLGAYRGIQACAIAATGASSTSRQGSASSKIWVAATRPTASRRPL